MTINKALMSSAKTEWETPAELFENLNHRFGFTLDPAASHKNAKCTLYYTEEDDGLVLPWSGNVWLNPPYGRYLTGAWIKKTYDESMADHIDMACVLLPARTDTKWFHDYVMPAATEIWYVKGRLRFVGAEHPAPFPSMLVFFDNQSWIQYKDSPLIYSCDKLGNILYHEHQ